MKDYELLEAQARMMRMAEKHCIDDWRKLVKVSNYEITGYVELATRFVGHNELAPWPFHKFAFGVVEGKPVFKGDTLWNVPNKFGFVADAASPVYADDCIWSAFDDQKHCKVGGRVSDLSWNPPKPKTVMVELPFDFVKVNAELNMDALVLHEACRKALEEMK